MRNTLSGHTKHTVRNAGRAFPAHPAHPEETAVGMKRTCRTQKDALRKPEWEMPGHNMSARFNLKNQNEKTSCGIPDHTALEANQALCIIRVPHCRNAFFITLLHNAQLHAPDKSAGHNGGSSTECIRGACGKT